MADGYNDKSTVSKARKKGMRGKFIGYKTFVSLISKREAQLAFAVWPQKI